ncbi:MAG: class I SAM-dependent methyltransferase [Gemmatimonadota bacterium]
MCCPVCRAELSREGDVFACAGGTHTFPMHEGIPLLAIQGTTETWAGERPSETSAEYQEAYQDLEAARLYNEAYRDQATKRWSTRREFTLLERHLASQPRSQTLLDLPSGGGRLSEQLARHTNVLVEADIGLGQLLYASQKYDGPPDRVWMTASGFHIPFQDEGVDGVVCCRLCHHLPTAVERERLLAELLRVARRFVVMSFFDHYSIKNWIRRARRPFDGQPPKMTMTVARVRELAAEHGAELVAQPPLSRAFSGHRYALLVKR